VTDRELTAQERAALVTWLLAGGAQMTTGDVATVTGLTPRGARTMLERLSRVIPIRQNEAGRWICVYRGRNSSPMCDNIKKER